MMKDSNILVVDDEPTICQLMDLFLSKRGYRVTIANNGEEALRIFDACRPSIVLLDISMPGMLGTEILQRIKSIDASCGVIVLSGYGDEETINDAINNGAFCYIQKPIELLDLSEKLVALQATMAA